MSKGIMKRIRIGSTSPVKINPEQCVICKEVAKDDVLECSWCECLVHGDCIKISSSQSTVLSEIVSNVLFFCPSCMHKLPTALSCFDKTSEIQFSIDSKFQSMEQSFTTKINSLGNQLKELEAKCLANSAMETSDPLTASCANISDSSISALSTANKSVDISNALSTALAEEKERSKRQLNLIIHNLEEAPSEDAQTRKDQDAQKATEIFQHLGIKTSVKNAIRLRKKGDKKDY